MTSAERVQAVLAFKQPDRLPRWDNFDIFGDFPDRWRGFKGLGKESIPQDFYGIDCGMNACEEGPFFTRSRVLRQEGPWEVLFDSWGRTFRHRPGETYFLGTIETVLEEKGDLDRLVFDAPDDPARFTSYAEGVQSDRLSGRVPFSKVGGIYCRSQFMRREDRLLMDMATDALFCHALFGRVTEHLTGLALAALRLTDSWDTGIWFYDDSANVLSPMFSPAMWEKYLLPLYKKMIGELREAGCQHVYLHSDGNITPFLPMMLEAGIEGVNPLEPRSNDLLALRKQFGDRMVFFGGSCNTRVLPKGDPSEIESMVRELAELGRHGGLVVGAASIGNDISPASYDFYIQMLEKYGQYEAG
ncbi:MAG: uroporphyrinogen decarboxylase family protein [Candidatus Latescibacterota bacterium]